MEEWVNIPFVDRLTRRMTIRLRLDPLARAPHFLERVLVWVTPFFVRKAPFLLLPRLLVHSVRLRRIDLANLVLQRGQQILSSLAENEITAPDCARRSQNWRHWSFQTGEADFQALETRIRALNFSIDVVEKVRQGILEGQLLWEAILDGAEARWNDFVISAPPDAYFSSQRVHGIDEILVALGSVDYRFAVVPHYALGQLNLGPDSTILSFHTAGREPRLVHVKDADLPPYLVVDSDGFGGWSSFATVTRHEAVGSISTLDPESYCRAFVDRYRITNTSKYPQPIRRMTQIQDRPTLFVALQVNGDMTHLQAFWSPEKMVVLTCLLAIVRGWKVFIKPHPRGAPKFALSLARLFSYHRNISVVDQSVHDLIEQSDAVVTVNSGVGSEALMSLKPVYCFGLADYSTGVHVIRNVRQFFKEISKLTLPADRRSIAEFAASYRTRLLVDGTDTSALLRKVHQMRQETLRG